MSEEAKTNPKPRSGRVLRIALFVSLALNLIIVGLVAGAVLDNRGKIGPRGQNPRAALDAGIGPFGQAMTREQRRAFGEEFRKRSGDLQSNRAEVRENLSAVLDAITAQPFDPAALQAAFDASQAALGQRQRIGSEVLLGSIAAMSDEDRAEFARKLRKSLRGMERGRP